MSGKRQREVPNGGRRKVDPHAPPRLVEEEVDDLRRENEERNRRLQDGRLRFGPLRGDAPRSD